MQSIHNYNDKYRPNDALPFECLRRCVVSPYDVRSFECSRSQLSSPLLTKVLQLLLASDWSLVVSQF